MSATIEKPKVGSICWTELATKDVAAAKDFYGKVFGWQFKEVDCGGMTYTMMKAEGMPMEFGGMWSIPKEQQEFIPPNWMSYILVTNCDESLASAQKHGAKVVKESMNVGDFGRMAVIQDPTGAHIAMWQPLKEC